MLRSVVRIHTGILAAASVALLIAPIAVLGSFGLSDPPLGVLALARVLAGVLAVVAAAVLPIPQLPAPARAQALTALSLAYGLLAALALAQQVAIWSSLAGALLTTSCALYAVTFAWLASAERKVAVAGLGA